MSRGSGRSPKLAVSETHVPSRLGDFTGDGQLDVLWSPWGPTRRGQTSRWLVAGLGDAPEAGEVVFEATADATRILSLPFTSG